MPNICGELKASCWEIKIKNPGFGRVRRLGSFHEQRFLLIEFTNYFSVQVVKLAEILSFCDSPIRELITFNLKLYMYEESIYVKTS
jgi:hypothetical protein